MLTVQGEKRPFKDCDVDEYVLSANILFMLI